MKKRILVFVLALVLIVSCISLPAYCAEAEDSAARPGSTQVSENGSLTDENYDLVPIKPSCILPPEKE